MVNGLRSVPSESLVRLGARKNEGHFSMRADTYELELWFFWCNRSSSFMNRELFFSFIEKPTSFGKRRALPEQPIEASLDR